MSYIDLFLIINEHWLLKRIKVKVSPIYDPYVGGVSVREDTCPEPSAL